MKGIVQMKIVRAIRVLAAFALLLFPLSVRADEKAESLLKEVETTLASLRTLSVKISATIHDYRPDRTPLTTFTGKARFMRPNLAWIEYAQASTKKDGAEASKERMVIAADGNTLWRFDSQKNVYRKWRVASNGNNIPVADALPIDGTIFMFFQARVPHTNAPPTYIGTETWNGKPYRVIEFREGETAPTEAPMIRQRFYIGEDNLIHRFVNEQLKGKFVEECVLQPIQVNAPMHPTAFAYAPPPRAKAYVAPPPPMLAAGTAAPDLVIEDRDGKPVGLADLRGKVVVLDFWTTGCGHCLESMSHLNDVARKFSGEAVILAVNVGDTKEAFADWLLKHPQYDTLRFTLATSAVAKEKAMMAYQVPGFPMQYVIGKDGKIVKGLLGYDGPTPELEKAIKTTLAASP